MKKFFAILCGLGLALSCPRPTFAATAYVQSAGSTTVNAVAGVITLAAGNWSSGWGAGNLLLTCFITDSGASVTSVAGNGGDTFVLAKSFVHGGAGADLQACYYAKNIVGGGTVNIVITLSGSTFGYGTAWELSGADTTAPLGQTNANECTSSCGVSPISVTSGSITAASGSIVIINMNTDSGTAAVTAPWNNSGTTGNTVFKMGYQAAVTPGGYNGAGTDTGVANDDWQMMIMEFKAPSGAGTGASTGGTSAAGGNAVIGD